MDVQTLFNIAIGVGGFFGGWIVNSLSRSIIRIEDRIAEMVQQRFELSVEAFNELKALSEQRRREQIDLWGFTSTIKKKFSPAQKMQVMEMLWSVVYADQTLADHEDHLIHTLAKLLDIDHRDMIAAKVKVINESKPSN